MDIEIEKEVAELGSKSGYSQEELQERLDLKDRSFFRELFGKQERRERVVSLTPFSFFLL